MNFESRDIDQCRLQGHKFTLVGSDKTPMKRSLVCETCSAKTGKNVYVAYGVEAGSFGQWRRPQQNEEQA